MLKRFSLNDYALFLGVIGIYAALYLFNNNFHYFELWHIPRTQFDDMVVFSPYWIYIYLAAYLLPVFMFFYMGRLKLHNHFMQLFFILTIITNAIFFLFPSTIERPAIPAEGLDAITKLAFDLLFSADKPFNCFPRTHVSTALIAALAVKHHPPLNIIFSIIALLITALSIRCNRWSFRGLTYSTGT
jgi:hypothetical protein